MRHKKKFMLVDRSYQEHIKLEKLYLAARYKIAVEALDYKNINAIERYGRKTFGYNRRDLERLAKINQFERNTNVQRRLEEFSNVASG